MVVLEGALGLSMVMPPLAKQRKQMNHVQPQLLVETLGDQGLVTKHGDISCFFITSRMFGDPLGQGFVTKHVPWAMPPMRSPHGDLSSLTLLHPSYTHLGKITWNLKRDYKRLHLGLRVPSGSLPELYPSGRTNGANPKSSALFGSSWQHLRGTFLFEGFFWTVLQSTKASVTGKDRMASPH